MNSSNNLMEENMKDIKPVLLVVIALVMGGLGFFGGIQYQKSKTSVPGNFGRGMMGNRGSGSGQQRFGNLGNGQALRPVSGKIISLDDKSVTVEQNDGSSKIVLFSSSMTINKATNGAKSDLSVGVAVRIFGVANSDGSITAQNIQLNPAAGIPSDVQSAPNQ